MTGAIRKALAAKFAAAWAGSSEFPDLMAAMSAAIAAAERAVELYHDPDLRGSYESTGWEIQPSGEGFFVAGFHDIPTEREAMVLAHFRNR